MILVIIELTIAITIVYGIIKDIKNRVDNNHADNPEDKELK